MANIDVLVKTKPPSDEHEEHPKYKSFCELIENFKTGELNRSKSRAASDV